MATSAVAIDKPKLAIATSFAYSTEANPSLRDGAISGSSGCGLVKWCWNAAAFAALPFHIVTTEIVLLTNKPAIAGLECGVPHRSITFDSALWSEIEQFARAVDRSRSKGLTGAAFAMRTMIKWQLLRHSEYSAFFYLDPDVDLWYTSQPVQHRPPAEGSAAWRTLRRAWTTELSDFLRSPKMLIASIDGSVPVNTGVMLLRPEVGTYELGRRVLRTRRFDTRNGFNNSGSPRQALPLDFLSAADRTELNHSRMVRENHWDVVCADADQGLFTHVFLVLQRGIQFRLSRPRPRGQGAGFRVAHFWGHGKPWEYKTLRSCPTYLGFLDLREFRHEPSACLTMLHSTRAREKTRKAPVHPRRLCAYGEQRVF